MTDPTVSVIIPTRNRPTLVTRAVASALNQPGQSVEIIVVIDGPDSATLAALSILADPRLRVIELPERSGGSKARNVGIEAALGKWVAFLDDDDEWLPHKLERQLACAARSSARYPIVSGKLIARTAGKDLIWPRREPYQPVCEYLFARSSWSYGEGLLSTITLLAPRELALAVPFTSSLRKHQDFEWILKATAYPGTSLEFVSEPIAIWHMAEGRSSVSTTDDWKWSWNWISSHRSSITRRAYSGFLVTQVTPQAARQKKFRAFPFLFCEIFLNGWPTPFQLALFFSFWLTPRWLRRYVRLGQSGKRPMEAVAGIPVAE